MWVKMANKLLWKMQLLHSSFRVTPKWVYSMEVSSIGKLVGWVTIMLTIFKTSLTKENLA